MEQSVFGGNGRFNKTNSIFDVEVSDVDLDVDALRRHDDAVWTPTNPSTQTALNDLEDRCEVGADGGLAIPVTDPGASLLPTRPADTGKALRVAINAKKAGKLAFTGGGTKLAVYRQSGAQQNEVTQPIDVTTSGLNEIFYLHTCTGFTAVSLVGEFTPTGSTVKGKDTVRIYPATDVCQLFVNTPATTDDYVPVEACGRVPITVTRDPSTDPVEWTLGDISDLDRVTFYDASTGGTGVTDKTITMEAGVSSVTLWVSGDASGKGERTLKVFEGSEQKAALDVFVFDMILKTLSFGGTGRHTMQKTGTGFCDPNAGTYESNGSTTIVSPEWKDGNGDRTIDNPAVDKLDPVCYTRGKRPTITADFEFSPALPAAAAFRIVGDQEAGRLEATTEQVFSNSGGVITKTFYLADYRSYSVGCWSLNFRWKLSIGDSPQVAFGSSETEFFVTYGTPVIASGSLTVKRLYLPLHLAQGTCTPEDIASAIGPNATSNARFDRDGSIFENISTAWKILDGTKADCISLATLMKYMLDVVGATGSEVRCVYPCHADWSHLWSTSRTASEPGSGGPLGFWWGSWNNYEGCCIFIDKWWMGGLGQFKNSPKEVLMECILPNQNGAGKHQCWFNDKATAVSYPNP